MMVLSAAQMTMFFEDLSHTGNPHLAVIQLKQEYIIIVEDISDFNKTTIEQLATNLCCPASCVQDLNLPENVDVTIMTLPFMFTARSCTRLMTAAKLVRYYDTVYRVIITLNMAWYQTVKNIQVQWKSLA